MRRIRLVGLCLVASLALGALFASMAQASGPEWGRCEKTKGGKYTEKSCLTEATQKNGKYKGKYEWHSLKEEEEKYTEPRCIKQAKGNYTESKCKTVAVKIKKGKEVPDHKGSYEKIGPYFTGTGGTGILNEVLETCYINGEIENGPGARTPKCDHQNNAAENQPYVQFVECASEQNSGRAVGVNEVTSVKVTFTGCNLDGSIPCKNTATEGEIVVNPLKGHLGYIEKSAHPKVGILLEPETAGGLFAAFECAGGILKPEVGVGSATEGSYYKGTGHDSVIAPITPIDTPATGFEQVFTDGGEAAENEPGQFEGEGSTIHRLETTLTAHNEEGTRYTPWARAGQSITNRNTTEGMVEIRA